MRFTPAETAKYLADQSVELQKLADSADLKILAHIFGMARIEAQLMTTTTPIPKMA